MRKGVLAFMLLTLATALGRIVVMGALVLAAVGFGLVQFGGSGGAEAPGGLRALGGVGPIASLTGGLDRIAQLLPGGGSRAVTASVIDVPAEIERQRKAPDAYTTAGGAMIVVVGR